MAYHNAYRKIRGILTVGMNLPTCPKISRTGLPPGRLQAFIFLHADSCKSLQKVTDKCNSLQIVVEYDVGVALASVKRFPSLLLDEHVSVLL